VDLKEKWCEGMEWFQLTEDSVLWLALVNKEINLQVP
jgi:hypothetical protein